MRLLVLLAAALPLGAQITVDNYAGGVVRAGVPAQNVFLDNISGLTWDAAGGIVFCDQTNHAIRRVRADGILETVAGMGVMGFSGDGGPATSALLNAPLAPRYDAPGNLCFVERGNYRIRRIDTKGIITTVAGDGIPFAQGMDTSGPALERSLDYVTDLEVDAAGDVYLLEAGLNRIRRVSGGQIQGFVTLPPGVYSSGMAIDGAGNLYLNQTIGINYEAIVRIAPDGTLSNFRVWTTTGEQSVPGVGAIAADAAGNVYVVQQGAIARFGADGSTTTVAGGGTLPEFGYVSSPDGPAAPSVIYPNFLAVDGQGDVAFADTFTPLNHYLTLNEVRVVTAGGQLRTMAGANPQIVPDGTPLGSAWFEQLASIAFSRTGDLYIAESRACKIRKVGADGTLSTFAGTGNCAYPAPSGPNAKTSDIAQPYSLAVDSQNRVWVTDAYLNLYAIAQDGTISKIIKTPVEGGNGSLAIDAQDRVYVLGLDSLYRVLPDFSYQAIVPPPSNGGNPTLTDLTAIGADAAGNIYFSPFGMIYAVASDGTFAPVYTTGVNANSLAIDGAGRFWEGAFSEIYVSSAAGVAGLGDPRAATPGDGGPAVSAGFAAANWVVFSPSGDLYFTDGNRIRRVTGIGKTAATPVISSVVNSLSYAGGAIAPGELVSIFGSNFGVAGLEVAAPGNNSQPTALGRTRVLFNGVAGAITAVTPNQINVFVPTYEIDSATSARVVVQVDATLSAAVTAPVTAAAPGIATADASGSGQGAILNQDGSLNSAVNPAARGSIVSMFGTGLGAMTPQLADGFLAISTPFPVAQAAVTVSIGGQPADVLYAGAAPFFPVGVFQINAQIPAGIAPGDAAVAVSAGGVGSSQQVTVAVR